MKFCVVFFMLTVFSLAASSQTFSKAECISRLSKEVDRPFRLSLTKATVRCNAIDSRIRILQKLILGKWKLIYSNDDSLKGASMSFLANGTVQWNNSTGKRTEKWMIGNPYGTLGAEVIQFGDESWVSPIKIQGKTMTISSQPASFETIERYKKIN